MTLAHTAHVDSSRSPRGPSQLQREGQASAFKKTLRTRTIAFDGVYQLGEQDGIVRHVNPSIYQNLDFIKIDYRFYSLGTTRFYVKQILDHQTHVT